MRKKQITSKRMVFFCVCDRARSRWFSLCVIRCCGFLTAQFSRTIVSSRWADDRTERNWFQTQEGAHGEAGSIGRALGKKSCRCGFLSMLFGDQCVVKSQVPGQTKATFRQGLHEKHLQAVSTRNVRTWSASSSSCHGEDQMLAYGAQLANDTELREHRKRSQSAQNEDLRSQVMIQSGTKIARWRWMWKQTVVKSWRCE